MKTKRIEVKKKRTINVGGYGNVALKNYGNDPVFVSVQEGRELKLESGESITYGSFNLDQKYSSFQANTKLTLKGRCTVRLEKPISNLVAYRRMLKKQINNQ
jgi:hypothetical protein